MKRLALFLVVLSSIFFIGANTQLPGANYQYATVDADPAAAGYWTNEVNASIGKRDVLKFSVTGTGTMTVTLQFKLVGQSTWVDYDTYTAATRLVLEDASSGVMWRAGVKDTDWTSGSMTFGFDW